LSESKPEEEDCSATKEESSESQQVENQQDDTTITLVADNRDDARDSGSSLSSSPLIKSAEYARTARQILVTSNLKAVRKVSNLRKTASSQAVRTPTQPDTEIKLISLSEARERHGLKRQTVKLESTSDLSAIPPSTLARNGAAVKEELKVSSYHTWKISAKTLPGNQIQRSSE
jgi:hypothetical protein